MDYLNTLSGCEIVTLANTIAISLARNLTTEEMALLAGLFTIIGDSLATISLTCNS